MNIDEVIKLAKIELKEDEKNLFSKQLDSIINWINELNELDTENIKPIFSITEMENNYYDDIPEKFDNTRDIINNFPNREYDFIKVKKVI
ncbi:MAG: Asp-tRNA(Asn)/Glu-tRNA(Gln) amidotransferase subunit GatC [Elusimicrobia bacterium]|nr:Asp-tRNA(Asn)/Glu-tRNA(Gln) amidotransferase subunit GatC [Elusimicrobiota bacterium]